MATQAKGANSAPNAATAAPTTNAPAVPATASAAAVAANPFAGLAATPTGQTAGKQQKLAYHSGTIALYLHPAKAKGQANQQYLAALQGVFGKASTMPAGAIPPALAAAGHGNPRRIYRRAIRAGILSTAQ
jgi:hypothetical protein